MRFFIFYFNRSSRFLQFKDFHIQSLDLHCMANTIVQNCQRGIIFITFLIVIFQLIFTIISLIKKRIDSSEEHRQPAEGRAKYEQSKPKGAGTEESADKIQAVIDASTVKEDDPTIIKVIKKYNEFMLNYFTLFIVIPLNILTGTSKAFSFVFYFFVLIVVIVFNVTKLHKKCFEHKCVLVILQNIWIAMLFFELLNIWAATPTLQPYIVIKG